MNLPGCHTRMTGVILALAWALLCSPAGAVDHPLSHSIVNYLPMPGGGEWTHVAVSPDGARVYLADAFSRIVVVNTATDTIAATITLPVNDFIGGLGIGPNGRVFVSTDTRLLEISPTTNQVIRNIVAPASWWDGPIVVTPNGLTAYVAAGTEVFVVSLAGGQIAFVDTLPGGQIDGLVAANPGWGGNWHRAWRIAVSPDGNRLYATGEMGGNGLFALHTIDGIAGGSTTSPLTLGAYDIPNPSNTNYAPRFLVSGDGATLFDSHWNVWQTSNMQVLQTIRINQLEQWEPALLARSPDGAYIYYQGWGTKWALQTFATYGGEGLLVAGGATYDLIDLDGTAGNGTTGINLPEANGWNTIGSYNAREMVITPDGGKLYIVAGSSGALVVQLTAAAGSGVVVPQVGGNNGRVTVRVTGSFTAGTTAALARSGQTDIVGTDTAVLSGGTLQTRFDLTGQPTGKYDLVFTPSGGTAWRIYQGFTIVEAREEATLDLLGSPLVTATAEGSAASIHVRATNTGNVDLEDLVVSFNFTEGTEFEFEVPPTVPGATPTSPEKRTAGADPVSIWIDRLPPGHTYTVPVSIFGQGGSPAQWNIEMEARAGYLKGSSGAGPCGKQGTGGKDQATASPIGELCQFGNAVVKGINTELCRRGHSSLGTDGADVVKNVIRNTAIEYGAAHLGGLVAKSIAQLAVTALVPGGLPVFAMTYGVVSDLKNCYDFIRSLLKFAVLFPTDPNDKMCTIGINDHITGSETLRYRIRFENLAAASAAAQTVRITDILEGNLDWDSLVIGASSHPDKLSVQFDAATRTITWTFTKMNLPPNVTPPEGQGWVEFNVKPASGVADGTTISNQARIIFDLNDPIDTNIMQRTIDRTAPQSAVIPLPGSVPSAITVSWSGSDVGSGLLDYTVMVSPDDAAYETWLEQTTATSGTYTGQPGRRYRFYSLSRDRLGNIETAPTEPDTTTTVSPPPCGACGAAAPAGVGFTLCALGLVRLRRRSGRSRGR